MYIARVCSASIVNVQLHCATIPRFSFALDRDCICEFLELTCSSFVFAACCCRETAWGDHLMLYGALQRLHMESRYDVSVWCAGILTLVLVR